MLGLIVLFILLSPGFLLTIPAIGGRYFRTNKTSPTAVIVHGIIFGLIVYFIRKYYSTTFFEGFVDTTLNSDITAEIDAARNKATTMINEINTILKNTTIPTDIRNKVKTQLTKITRYSGNLKQLKDEQLAKDIKIINDRQEIVNKLSTSATPAQRKAATDALARAKAAFDKTKQIVKSLIIDLNKELVPIIGMSSSGKIPTIPKGSSSFTMPSIPSMPKGSSSFAMPAPPSALQNMTIPKASSSYPMPVPMPPTDSRGPGITARLPTTVGAPLPGF